MNLSNATHPPQHLGRGNPDPTAFGYDPAGRRVAFDSPDLSAAYTYDDIDRLSQTSYDKRADIPSLPDEDYSYDPDGNRVASHLSDPAPAPAAEFNLRNQIIRDHLFEYRYDLNGNLTHKYLRETCASYRAQDVHSPCLDESSSEATPSFLFSHDEDNKMTAAHNIPQSLSIAIRYDPLGRRFHTKTYLSSGSVPPVIIQWRAFDGDDAFADFTTGPAPIPDPDVIGSSPAPALANLYLHGPGVDEPLAWWSLWTDSSGSPRFKPVLLLADGLGSITGLTANADYPAAPKPVQGLASSYHYDSFGNQVRHCDAPAAETSGSTFKLARLNPYRYAAREWLSLDWDSMSIIGVNDFRSRMQDPSLGRFFQEDPVWNMNPYIYVNNNPVEYFDPSGKIVEYKGSPAQVEKLKNIISDSRTVYKDLDKELKMLENSKDVYTIRALKSTFLKSSIGYYRHGDKEIGVDTSISKLDKFIADFPQKTDEDIVILTVFRHELRHAYQMFSNQAQWKCGWDENCIERDARDSEKNIRKDNGLDTR